MCVARRESHSSVNSLWQAFKNSIGLYPFSSQNLRAVNHFFKEQIDKIPLPKIYIPELAQVSSMQSMRKLTYFDGKSSGTVIHICEINNSAKWTNTWLILNALLTSNIFWEEIKFSSWPVYDTIWLFPVSIEHNCKQLNTLLRRNAQNIKHLINDRILVHSQAL